MGNELTKERIGVVVDEMTTIDKEIAALKKERDRLRDDVLCYAKQHGVTAIAGKVGVAMIVGRSSWDVDAKGLHDFLVDQGNGDAFYGIVSIPAGKGRGLVGDTVWTKLAVEDHNPYAVVRTKKN